MTEFALIGVLGLGWLLMLVQPLLVARESRSYLRSIGQFQRSLDALGAGLQPPRRPRPAEEVARRRQRALLGLVASALLGAVLSAVSLLLGLLLVTVSLVTLVGFVRVCATHPIAASTHRPGRVAARTPGHVEQERAIA
jgi:hypothetical protein